MVEITMTEQAERLGYDDGRECAQTRITDADVHPARGWDSDRMARQYAERGNDGSDDDAISAQESGVPAEWREAYFAGFDRGCRDEGKAWLAEQEKSA